MSSAIIQILYFVASYIIILIIGFALLQFLSNGFFSVFLRVKASRGKKILVLIDAFSDTYFKVGTIEDAFLTYKDRAKKDRRITLKANCGRRIFGVISINVDEDKNAVITPSGVAVSGFDSKKFDNLFVRCLTAPQMQTKKDVLLILGVLVVFGALAFVVYQQVAISGDITAISQAIEELNKIGVIQ